MAEHGRVIAVGDELLGDEFAEDTAAGSTVLQLVDVADFDENGGKVRIGGVVVDYLTVDDAAATMTLAAGLAADADAGDHLDAWDEATNTAAIDRIASVAFDGQTDGEAIECVVAQHLRRELPPGIRGEIGESVLIETQGDEWRVIDVLGVREQSAVRFYQDRFRVSALGTQELDLTYEPILHSEHFYWNGWYQDATQWSRAGSTITAPDVEGFLRIGDYLTVEYAYLPGNTAQKDIPGVPFEATGWKYLIVTEGDATDRSGTGFDDSAWDEGQGPFGNLIAEDGTQFSASPTTWGQPNTVHGPPVDYGIWIRRSVPDVPASGEVTIEVRVDGTASVYWNGNLVDTRSGDGTTDVASIAVPVAYLGGNNILAVHHVDDASDPSFDFIYIDVRVTW